MVSPTYKGTLMKDRYVDYWFRRGRDFFLDNTTVGGLSIGYDDTYKADGVFDTGAHSADSKVAGQVLDTPPTSSNLKYVLGNSGYTDFVFTGWNFYAIHGNSIDYIDMSGTVYLAKQSFGVTYKSICYDGAYYYLLTGANKILKCDALFNVISEFAEAAVGANVIRAYAGTVFKLTDSEIRGHVNGGNSINVLSVASATMFEVSLAGIVVRSSGELRLYELINERGLKWQIPDTILNAIQSMAFTHDPLTNELLALNATGQLYEIT